MSRNFLAALMALAACVSVSNAQTQTGTRARTSAEHSTSVSRQGRQLDIASGTRLSGELQNTLDVSKARVGDRVLLKTTEAVRSNGQTLVNKGSQLVGHIADVQRRAKGSAQSSVTVLFDTLQSGSLSTPISVTIDSITNASTRAHANGDDTDAEASASSRTSARSSAGGSSASGSSGGGLLGGAVGAVGNTVGGVTSAAGDVAGSTTETVGSTTRGVGQTLGQIQITQAAGVSAEGGSTLSLTGGNLRLEKGTTFRLTVNESARVGNSQ
ncbi:MAG: hypothetical protein QOC61_2030 [Acidobacteriota bacterium]|jgi:hypothetical protein|nr:hypothetical protein [Acidobacteriota bacterium]MDT5263026.1 hypothetical protein [Acidobacteriota bacterium]